MGSTANVSVDGTTGTIEGTVTQVGPVQSGESGYSYPVVVTLPASANNLLGSSANISIVTGEKKDVLAVPTSAVVTTGTQSYVLVLSGGNPVDRPIKVGIVGGIYTQVLSGLKRGQAVASPTIPLPSLPPTRQPSAASAEPVGASAEPGGDLAVAPGASAGARRRSAAETGSNFSELSDVNTGKSTGEVAPASRQPIPEVPSQSPLGSAPAPPDQPRSLVSR